LIADLANKRFKSSSEKIGDLSVRFDSRFAQHWEREGAMPTNGNREATENARHEKASKNVQFY